jgi:hypothetical protein
MSHPAAKGGITLMSASTFETSLSAPARPSWIRTGSFAERREEWGRPASIRIAEALRAAIYRLDPDADLVRRARHGDRAAFTALRSRYARKVRALADARPVHDDRGDDLREILIAAFQDLESFDARCAPGTWLFLHGIRAAFARFRPRPSIG